MFLNLVMFQCNSATTGKQQILLCSDSEFEGGFLHGKNEPEMWKWYVEKMQPSAHSLQFVPLFVLRSAYLELSSNTILCTIAPKKEEEITLFAPSKRKIKRTVIFLALIIILVTVKIISIVSNALVTQDSFCH